MEPLVGLEEFEYAAQAEIVRQKARALAETAGHQVRNRFMAAFTIPLQDNAAFGMGLLHTTDKLEDGHVVYPARTVIYFTTRPEAAQPGGTMFILKGNADPVHQQFSNREGEAFRAYTCPQKSSLEHLQKVEQSLDHAWLSVDLSHKAKKLVSQNDTVHEKGARGEFMVVLPGNATDAPHIGNLHITYLPERSVVYTLTELAAPMHVTYPESVDLEFKRSLGNCEYDVTHLTCTDAGIIMWHHTLLMVSEADAMIPSEPGQVTVASTAVLKRFASYLENAHPI